jgi:hypothetical protein
MMPQQALLPDRLLPGGPAMAVDAVRRAAADGSQPPSDSARGAILAGWAVILLFFGGFGAWAVTAPLNGAVVGGRRSSRSKAIARACSISKAAS